MLEELNPDLTNFILMDNVKTQTDMNECRLSVEKRFRLPVGKPKQYKKVDGRLRVCLKVADKHVFFLH